MPIYKLVEGSGILSDPTGPKVDTTIAANGGFTATIGDGSTTNIVVTHNLGTKDCAIRVYRVASPFDTIFVDAERTTTNTVTLKFASAPAAGQYRVIVRQVKP